MKQLNILISVLLSTFLLLTGCAETGARSSEEATREHPIVLRLAHNLSDNHVTSKALVNFANTVEKKSGGRIVIRIFPNGQLGSETEVLEQLLAGVVDITRVGSPNLANYADGYHAFGLPYIFDDQEHYYDAMDSDGMRKFFQSSYDAGLVGLTYYTSGARSFYTADKPIQKPSDLAGLKIRVQDMRSQTDMMRALGGTPIVMSYGDIYTALQTGIIDGAESNETALTTGKHGEISKVFSYDEHSMIPDMLAISSKTWDRLSVDDQKILVDSAIESTEAHKVAWDEEITKAIEEAKGMGVEFIEDVDKQAFQQATESMRESYAREYPGVASVLQIVDSARK